MKDGITITGLDGLTRQLGQFERRFEAMTRNLVRKAALLVVAELKKYIRDSSNFDPLHPVTIERKGSNKPLINHGDLINSITHKLMGDEGFFAGLLKGKKSAEGAEMVNIGWIMEHGVTINVTDRMRAYLHATGGPHLKKSTTVITIPARPFIEPVWKDVQPKIKELFAKGLQDQLQKIFR